MALEKSETQHSRFATLCVDDLSPDVTEKDLIAKFSSIAPVVSVHLCRNSVTRSSLCYAFVNFDSFLSALNAMIRLNNTDLKGKAMRIMLCRQETSYRPLAYFDTEQYAALGFGMGTMKPRPSLVIDFLKQMFLKIYNRDAGMSTESLKDMFFKIYNAGLSKEVLKEIFFKIYNTPRDARLPKVYEDNRDREVKLLPVADEVKETKLLKERISEAFPPHQPTLGEQCVRALRREY